jgi:hypothetical protein
MRDAGSVGDRRREIDVQGEDAGQPGPGRPPAASQRTTSGTRIDSSYGASFLVHRCSPCRIPLSEVNTIIVFSSRPDALERVEDPTDRAIHAEQRPVLVGPERRRSPPPARP